MKKVVLLPMSMLLLSLMVFVACSEDDDNEVCEPFTTPTTCSIDVTYCSSGDYGYYTYEGETYTCSDEACEDAINEILDAAGCTASADVLKSASSLDDTRAYMQAVAARVMAQARAAAGCE